MSDSLVKFGWKPGRWIKFRCRQCRDGFEDQSDFPHTKAFFASETSTHCRRCAQAAHDTWAARDILAERITAYVAVCKSVLAYLPHALNADGCEGLEAALDGAAKALKVWRELEVL